MAGPKDISERLVKTEVTLVHVREDISEIKIDVQRVKEEVGSVSDQQIVQTAKLVGLESTMDNLQKNVQEVLRVSKATALDTDIGKTLRGLGKEKIILAFKYGSYIAAGVAFLYGYLSKYLGNPW